MYDRDPEGAKRKYKRAIATVVFIH